jgi:hypothetical protein
VPLARYFIFVGGTLAALLFIAGECLPRPPAMLADQTPAVDRTIIRIRSAHKWPEKAVLDTSQPTMTPSEIEEEPLSAKWGWLASDEPDIRSNLEAMAQLKPESPPLAVDRQASQARRGRAKAVRSKHHDIRQSVRAERGESCCQFGWIESRQAMSRGDNASLWPAYWKGTSIRPKLR